MDLNLILTVGPNTSSIQSSILRLVVSSPPFCYAMDKSEKETHDFMNVDSFSQLPFIRPAPPKEKAIKLFGVEFGVDEELEEEKDRDNNGESSSRKFECHYCCRNFPTSQALGGHQNAHKRERQHAKRAHLQSAMVHESRSFTDHYGFYRNSNQPIWNSISNSSTRFIHGSSFTQQPISTTLWRIPSLHSVSTVNRDRSLLEPLPLFAGDRAMKPSLQVVGHGSGSTQSRFGGFDPIPTMQDHVSLDLHL